MAAVVAIQRPQRWDTPFGTGMSDSDVARILALPAFRVIDPSSFPPSMSLADIIRNDARVVRFERGDVIVRDGDYGSSVFVILSGAARVLLDAEAARRVAGRHPLPPRSVLKSLTQLWRRSRVPERRDVALYQSTGATGLRRDGRDQTRTSISQVGSLVAAFPTVLLEEGEMFGEIAALSRSARTATVFADSELEALELRWQGLRELRRRDTGFRARVDELYRSRDLTNHLGESPLLRHLDESTLRLIARHTALESHGDLEWFGEFKQVASRDPQEVIGHEPLIAEEGHYVDGLVIIRSGFARVSQRLDHGHRTVDYLTTNEAFGLEEITDHWRGGRELRLRSSLRAVGYVDILRIPTALVEQHILPSLPVHLVPEEGTEQEDPAPAWASGADGRRIEQSLLNALVDRRVVNGQAAMLIDTDRCVGCDECVAACAATHDNNPRFVRHGPAHANLMFANACMHCVDPVCLIGCPTGAIHRSPADLRVLIDDPTCIGCGTCADACPYDNIRLVEIRDSKGAFIIDEETHQPILKATKCDLCVGQLGGPACERACPHEALIRIDMRDRGKLADWVNRPRRSWSWFVEGALVAVAVAVFGGLDIVWETSLERTNLFSGWSLAAAVVLLALFAARKRITVLPLLPASWWLRGHVVVGLVAAALFIRHAGWAPANGVLEAALWTVSVLIMVSGAVGLYLSRILPPRLRLHGEAILYERISGLRRSLARQVEELVMRSARETASGTLADYYTRRLAGFFEGPRHQLGHLLQSRRHLAQLRQEVRHLERYLDPGGRDLLKEMEECIVAKDNLDLLHTLQQALRGWRLFHVPLTAALLLLAALHAVLVLAFSGGSP